MNANAIRTARLGHRREPSSLAILAERQAGL